MKLRNFMYATMIACAFASCSKDEVIDPEVGPEAKGDAELVISVNTVNAKGTKAGELTSNQSPDEMKINNISIHVYAVSGADDATKTWIASTSSSSEVIPTNATGTTTTFTIPAQSVGTKIVCYAYANTNIVTGKPAFGAPQTIAIPLTETKVTVSNLPMAGFSATKVLASGENIYTVDLVRCVSRVDVVRLDLSAKAATSTGLQPDAARFQLEGLSINGVVSSSMTDGTAAAAAARSFWGGLGNSLYGNAADGGSKVFYNTIYTDEEVVENAKTEGATEIEGCSVENPLVSYYILPNVANVTEGVNAELTKLVLQGKFGYTKGNTVSDLKTGYYAIDVAKDGITEAGVRTDGVIERNKVYRIGITVAGPGKDLGGGDKLDLIIQASVVDYAPISQNVVVE